MFELMSSCNCTSYQRMDVYHSHMVYRWMHCACAVCIICLVTGCLPRSSHAIYATVWCRYNVVNFLTNIHKGHPIARLLLLRASCGVSFVDPASDSYSASVPIIIHVISCNIGPLYNGTRLYTMTVCLTHLCVTICNVLYTLCSICISMHCDSHLIFIYVHSFRCVFVLDMGCI